MNAAKCFEVFASNGSLIFRVYVSEREVPVTDDTGKVESNEGNGKEQVRSPQDKGDGELMTSPQKRLLFRLMAQKGVEGDAAQEKLKEIFRAKSLRDVMKREASKAIERLLEEVKGGNGHGPSV